MSYFTNWTIRYGKTIVIKTGNNLAFTDLYAYTTSDSQLDNCFTISWTWPILRHGPTNLNKHCIPIRLLSVASRESQLSTFVNDLYMCWWSFQWKYPLSCSLPRSLALFADFFLFAFFFGGFIQYSLSSVLCYRSRSLFLFLWTTCRNMTGICLLTVVYIVVFLLHKHVLLFYEKTYITKFI